ncbi:MAG: hypothetical protein ACLUDU_21970 [Butyricimonas faecihominis]
MGGRADGCSGRDVFRVGEVRYMIRGPGGEFSALRDEADQSLRLVNGMGNYRYKSTDRSVFARLLELRG